MKQTNKRIIATTAALTCVVLVPPIQAPANAQGATPPVRMTVESTTTAGSRSQQAENRRIVQESSQRIAELVRLRPATLTPDATELELIDRDILRIQRERADALEAVVLSDNPAIEPVDRERGIYRVPVADGQNRTRWFSARIPAIWHLHRLDPAVFTLAESIQSRPQAAELPADTRVDSRLLVGGSSAQSMVQPFPGDIDYNEPTVVYAPTPAAAGEALASVVVELVTRTARDPRLEFDALRVMPLPPQRVTGTDYRWPLARILDPAQRTELARQLSSVNLGRVNTDWRALVSDGRYIIIGKIFGIDARSSLTGERLFATEPLRLDFQVLYFGEEVPPTHREVPLGDYAALMLAQIKYTKRKKHYLKMAKRTFNFCRAVADLECLAAVTPIFSTPEASVYHSYKVLEAIAMALDPATPSRILTADNARKQLIAAAAVVEANLPVVPGTLPERPKGIANQLRGIAAAIRARTTKPAGIVEPDAALWERMNTLLDVELKSMIRLSLKERVEAIVDTHLR